MGIIISFVINVVIWSLAFPEVAIWLFCVGVEMWSKDSFTDLNAPQNAGIPTLLRHIMEWIHQNITTLHPVYRIVFLVGVIAIYFALLKLVHVKGVYPFQIIGALFTVFFNYWFIRLVLTDDGKRPLDMVWLIALTIIVSLITLGMRLSVLSRYRDELS